MTSHTAPVSHCQSHGGLATCEALLTLAWASLSECVETGWHTDAHYATRLHLELQHNLMQQIETSAFALDEKKSSLVMSGRQDVHGAVIQSLSNTFDFLTSGLVWNASHIDTAHSN
jgi:hypothetical protein